MANVRDSDTSLWLHNKLGTSNDSWTGGSICSQLNAEVLRNIKDCFPDLQTQVKLKLLLSFFHIPRRNVEEWHTELEEILEVAQVDSEQWVSMLAEIMKTLPSTGSLNTDIGFVDENRRIFSDLVNDLKKLALRAELLQKSVDAASNLKKSTAPTVPVRSRGMPRKMTDTTPLKGIPSSRIPPGGFRSPTISRPPLPRTPAGRKDGGIKLLDINEQPLGYAQAKKRKRLQEIEEAKKASEAAAQQQQLLQQQNQQTGTNQSTPDYAVGLTAMNPPTPAPPTPSYSPATPQHSVTTIITIPREATATPTTTEVVPQAQSLLVATTTSTPSYAPLVNAAPLVTTTTQAPTPTAVVASPAKQMIQIRPAPQVAQIRIQPVNAAAGSNNTLQRKGLSLTREQMLEAQEMFRTANKVTRDDTVVPTTVETHFQMNYNTGEWKRIKKYRKIEEPIPTPVPT
ncbi:Negative elongation factor A [Blattella germanica]|nr:Negative elongation factor A [Blattella germanica]